HSTLPDGKVLHFALETAMIGETRHCLTSKPSARMGRYGSRAVHAHYRVALSPRQAALQIGLDGRTACRRVATKKSK
ncbi:hypothetical protein, partial [Thiomonas sp.]